MTNLTPNLQHPKPFFWRSRSDRGGLGQAASHRDRDLIVTELKADEEPLEIPIRRRPAPRRDNPFKPPPPMSGWAFVDHVRTNRAPRRIAPVIQRLWGDIELDFDYDNRVPDGFMYIDEAGVFRVQAYKQAAVTDWTFYALHLLHHLVLGYLAPPPDHPHPELWQLAAEMLVNQYISATSMITAPANFPNAGQSSRFGLLNRFAANRQPPLDTPDSLVNKWLDGSTKLPYTDWLTPAGVRIWDIMDVSPDVVRHYRSMFVLDQVQQLKPEANKQRKYIDTMITRAYQWVVDHFPLLSAAAAEFELDFDSAKRYNIAIGAVSARDQVIYVNPEAGLGELEWRWVLVHEILHVVLEHQQRLHDRDALIWNVACDYVINLWLEQMGVGMRPQNVLYKEDYKGRDAESVYEELMANGGNEQLKIVTFRGDGMGDMLDFDPDYYTSQKPRFRSRFRPSVRNMAQNAAREMLEDESNGRGRGLLPGDLVDELDLSKLLQEQIEAPEWKTELAEWFNVQFLPKPPRRSYTRLSRRQSSVPHIPLAGKAQVDYHSPTFGVLLDTSGSMSHDLLQKGLSALIAFADQQGVAYVRLVMCDTRPFDEGFIPLEKLRRPYRIWGRGGTILQPGIDLLENLEDFPEDAPLLIITDGEIDVITVTREHAFLLPGNGDLPFEPIGPVFRILGDNENGSPFRRRTPRPLDDKDDQAPHWLRPPADSRPRFGSSQQRTAHALIERIKNL